MGKPAGYWVNKIRTSFKGGSSSSKSLDEGSTSGSRKNDSKHSKNQKTEEGSKNGEGGAQAESGRKVMVVVDTTSQSKNALQWALTHCVQDEDNITLLHVTRTPIAQGIYT